MTDAKAATSDATSRTKFPNRSHRTRRWISASSSAREIVTSSRSEVRAAEPPPGIDRQMMRRSSVVKNRRYWRRRCRSVTASCVVLQPMIVLLSWFATNSLRTTPPCAGRAQAAIFAACAGVRRPCAARAQVVRRNVRSSVRSVRRAYECPALRTNAGEGSFVASFEVDHRLVLDANPPGGDERRLGRAEVPGSLAASACRLLGVGSVDQPAPIALRLPG